MKIYIVTHRWTNGEQWEEYQEYEESSYFSTLELAAKEYWNGTRDYIGKYVLCSVELDTQNKHTLAESEWKHCPSVFQMDFEEFMESQEEPSSQDYGLKDYSYYCDDLYYWRYTGILRDWEEEALIEEWLTHEGENYQILKELEEDKEFDQLLCFLKYKDRE